MVIEAMDSCVTMVDLAMSMLKIEEIPILVGADKKETTEKVFDETSAYMRTPVYKAWLSPYPNLGILTTMTMASSSYTLPCIAITLELMINQPQ